jgi:hypothetical protein
LQKNNSRAQKSLSAAAGSDFYNNILHGVLLKELLGLTRSSLYRRFEKYKIAY